MNSDEDKIYMKIIASDEMTSNEKSLNYKVIDLVRSYNFHINFISIRAHTKKLQFFENELNPTTIPHDVCRRCSTRVVYGMTFRPKRHRHTTWR
jgi:hypothetical protein